MSARTYAETIQRINAIVEDMSSLQKEKRRLVKRLMHELKPASMATSDAQTDRTIHPARHYSGADGPIRTWEHKGRASTTYSGRELINE